MIPANIIKLCMDIITNNVVPFSMGIAKTRIENRLEKDMYSKQIELDNKKLAYLDKLEHTPSTPVKTQELGLSDFKDLDEFHNAKWVQYFGTIEDLADNADSVKVRNTMNEILSDIRVYPCDTCRENSDSHLSELERKGMAFTDIETKTEAIRRLCDFKNEVNKTLGKSMFDCNMVVDNGYQT